MIHTTGLTVIYALNQVANDYSFFSDNNLSKTTCGESLLNYLCQHEWRFLDFYLVIHLNLGRRLLISSLIQLYSKGTPAYVFSGEFCEIFKKTFFKEHM